MASHQFFSSLKDLLRALLSLSRLKGDERFLRIYETYAGMLKTTNGLLGTDPPDFRQVERALVKGRARSPVKRRALMIWVISGFEFLTGKGVEDLTRGDWQLMAEICETQRDCDRLRYKFFNSLRIESRKWSVLHDYYLKSTIYKLYPNLFQNSGTEIRLRWALIAFEFNKNIQSIWEFRNDKQCKERWFNHLSPFLNKKTWGPEEDVRLLELSLVFPKRWSRIAQAFSGRTQHQVKNRFISLLNQRTGLKREKIRKIINKNDFLGFVRTILSEGLEETSVKTADIDEFINYGSYSDSLTN